MTPTRDYSLAAKTLIEEMRAGIPPTQKRLAELTSPEFAATVVVGQCDIDGQQRLLVDLNPDRLVYARKPGR